MLTRLTFAHLFGLAGRRRKREDRVPAKFRGIPSEEEKSNTSEDAAAWSAGRAAERARFKSIVEYGLAEGNFELARTIATTTGLDFEKAKALFNSLQRIRSRSSLSERMARVPQVRIPPGGFEMSPEAAIAASWARAMAPYTPKC